MKKKNETISVKSQISVIYSKEKLHKKMFMFHLIFVANFCGLLIYGF